MGKHGATKVSKMSLMKKYEQEAINSFEENRIGEQRNSRENENVFIAALRKSPSVHTLDLAVTLAVEAGWHKALEELLVINPTTYKPIKGDMFHKHPLQDHVLKLFRLPPACDGPTREIMPTSVLICDH